MPHYRDGTEAKVGDLVSGKSYNRNGKVITGTVISITKGSESCNCRVAFVEEIDMEKVYGHISASVSSVGVSGEPLRRAFFTVAEDYGETRAFDLIARPEEATA